MLGHASCTIMTLGEGPPCPEQRLQAPVLKTELNGLWKSTPIWTIPWCQNKLLARSTMAPQVGVTTGIPSQQGMSGFKKHRLACSEKLDKHQHASLVHLSFL